MFCVWVEMKLDSLRAIQLSLLNKGCSHKYYWKVRTLQTIWTNCNFVTCDPNRTTTWSSLKKVITPTKKKTCKKTFERIFGYLIRAEERDETRTRVDLRGELFCYSQRGKQNNILTREKLILAMCFIEQNFIILRCRTDINDQPAQPLPALPGQVMMLFDGLFLICVKRYEIETYA